MSIIDIFLKSLHCFLGQFYVFLLSFFCALKNTLSVGGRCWRWNVGKFYILLYSSWKITGIYFKKVTGFLQSGKFDFNWHLKRHVLLLKPFWNTFNLSIKKIQIKLKLNFASCTSIKFIHCINQNIRFFKLTILKTFCRCNFSVSNEGNFNLWVNGHSSLELLELV